MNAEHLALCSGAEWAEQLRAVLLPWAMSGGPPLGNLLEVGPGPGAATEVLRTGADRLTAVEYDPGLAAALRRRFAGDRGVRVVDGDAAALPFEADRFDAVASFTMLHHLPDTAAQDRAFAEFARVLRPGAVLFGTDTLDSPRNRLLHEGDVLVPLDPLTLGERLERAGFVDAEVAVRGYGMRFRAVVPG